jgi:dTDP-4-dehydrorhamnose 3,5-epimerase
MKFHTTRIAGALLVEPQRYEDERGFFARTFCATEFRQGGLDPVVEQCSVSFNARRGTLRGMHAQRKPHEETKLVRCVRGAIHDVIVDLRRESPTYLQHVGVELSAETGLAVYVPKGVFHGFITLADSSEVYYQMSTPYVAAAATGYRWNDPAFGIVWPLEVAVIAPRDASYADYEGE